MIKIISKSVTWLRLYFRITDEGMCAPPAIVTIGSYVMEYKMKDIGNGMARTVHGSTRYWMRINLWIIQLEFDWKKYHDTRNEKA